MVKYKTKVVHAHKEKFGLFHPLKEKRTKIRLIWIKKF